VTCWLFCRNNPSDGSDWKLLCAICHGSEQSRYIDNNALDLGTVKAADATSNPFANLAALMAAKKS